MFNFQKWLKPSNFSEQGYIIQYHVHRWEEGGNFCQLNNIVLMYVSPNSLNYHYVQRNVQRNVWQSNMENCYFRFKIYKSKDNVILSLKNFQSWIDSTGGWQVLVAQPKNRQTDV